MSHNESIALKRWLASIGAQENVALAPFSTIKVGGCARYFVLPNTIDELRLIQKAALEHDMKLHVLSGGSNTLFSDEGFFGIVVKLSSRFDFIKASDDGLSITVGAATSFAKVTKMALLRGWSHALGFCGTPGLVGGAIRMNAGTRMGEIKDALFSVKGVSSGNIIQFHKNDLSFGYRSNNLPDDFIICEATLTYDRNLLTPTDELLIKVQEYRQYRRKTQPTINSLGSFFKNPYPSFAALLIEKCNLKGLSYKGAQISPLHANFIVNNGGATAHDILSLATHAQKAVFEQFGIILLPEIREVGFSTRSPLSSTKALICHPRA